MIETLQNTGLNWLYIHLVITNH